MSTTITLYCVYTLKAPVFQYIFVHICGLVGGCVGGRGDGWMGGCS